VRLAAFSLLVAMLGGCLLNGTFHGPTHEELVATQICLYRQDVGREVAGLNPLQFSGSWSQYWDYAISFNVLEEPDYKPTDRGPSFSSAIQWMLSQRRQRGLPDLSGLQKSGQVLPALYDTLEQGTSEVTAWMTARKWTCSNWPAA